MALLPLPILRRFERFTGSLHPAVARDVRRRLSFLSAPVYRGALSNSRQLPVWMLLPRWLARKWDSDLNAAPIRRGFLTDVLWGQFCLYALIKLHDDVFDGHVDTPGLIFAGDAFLVEARRCFARHFEADSPFWHFHDAALRKTLSAITAVDESQLRAEARYPVVARLYTDGYAVCKTASHAVCLAAGHVQAFRRVSEYLDGFAIAGQVLDDLEDMESDLERGRVNFAAASFARRARPRGFTKEETAKYLVRGIVMTDASDRLFARLAGEIDRSARAMRVLSVLPAIGHASRLQKAIGRIAEGYRRKRVDVLFGGLIPR